MSNTFAITTATNSVILNDSRQGEVSFTVANVSGRQLPARAHIVPQGEAQADWFTLAGDSEREFAIAGVQQYTVRIQVPPEATPGNYLFRLDAVGIRVPDEEFAEGPSVTFVVPEQQEKAKPFPWWLVAVGAVSLLVIAVVVVNQAWPPATPTPSTLTPTPTSTMITPTPTVITLTPTPTPTVSTPTPTPTPTVPRDIQPPPPPPPPTPTLQIIPTLPPTPPGGVLP